MQHSALSTQHSASEEAWKDRLSQLGHLTHLVFLAGSTAEIDIGRIDLRIDSLSHAVDRAFQRAGFQIPRDSAAITRDSGDRS